MYVLHRDPEEWIWDPRFTGEIRETRVDYINRDLKRIFRTSKVFDLPKCTHDTPEYVVTQLMEPTKGIEWPNNIISIPIEE